MKKKLLSIVLVAVLAVTFIACGQSKESGDEENKTKTVDSETDDTAVDSEDSSADELVTKSEAEFDGDFVIKVGDNDPGYFIWKVADEKGFLEEEFSEDNISVELETFSGGPAVIEALAAGEIQYGVAAVDPLINSASNGADLTSVLSIGNSIKGNAIYARKETGIESLEDLKGHTVAVLFGTSRYNTLLLGLQSVGLTPDDVEILNLSNADTVTAIQTGQADAAVLTAGLPTDLIEATNVVAYADDIRDNYNIIIANNEFAKEHPYTTARLLRALQKTNEWIAENKEESIQIYADRTEAELETAELYYETAEFHASFDADELTAGYQTIIDLVLKYDIIDNEIKAEDIIDDQYAKIAGIAD